MPSAHAAAPPQIPDYEMLRIIGRGNYGEVWLARNLTGQYRAVKVVWRDRFPDPAPFDREFRGLTQFARVSLEARRQLALLHVGSQESLGFFYYVMELADDVEDGRDIRPDRYVASTLRQMRERRGRLPAGDVIRLGVEITEALDELHRRGLVHRDIKPSNIILVGGAPKLADIGLVAAVQDARTEIGTPGYMPPEGPGSPSADVFAVGKVLYELATGLDRHEFPRLPEGLSSFPDRGPLLELNAVLLRASERDATRRFKDAGQLLEELKLLHAGRSVQRLRRAERRSRRALRALLVALPVALVAAPVAWRESRLRAERDLALYRANLDQAVINVERGRSGPAMRALTDAASFPRRGIEFDLVQRQARGDSGIVVPFPRTGVDDLKFSADGHRLAILGQVDFLQIYSVEHREVLTNATDPILLAGFLGPEGDAFAGTSSQPVPGHDDVRRPMRTWDTLSGHHLIPTFAEGYSNNLPIRVLADQSTVAFMNRGRTGEYGLWRPFQTNASLDWRRWGMPPTNSRPWLRAMDARGNRFLHIAESGSGTSFRSHGFWFDFAAQTHGNWTHSNTISALAMTEDGSQAAVAVQQTGDIQTGPWNDNGWAPLHRWSQGETLALAFSHDGRHLASGGEDEWIRIHETTTYSLVARFQGLQAPVTALAWSPDGQWLAAGDQAGNVRLWPMASPEPTDDVWAGFPGSGGPLQLVTSADGAWIAVPESDTTVSIREARNPGIRTVSVTGFSPLAFSTNGATLWTLGNNGRISQVDRLVGRVIREFETLPPNAHTSIFGGATPSAQHAILCAEKQVFIWDLARVQQIGSGVAHKEDIVDVAVADQKPLAITVSNDGAVLWNLEGATFKRLDRIADRVKSATFFDHDQRAVLGTEEGTLIEVDVSLATAVAVHQSPLQRNYQLVTSKDGRRVITGGSNGRIAILDTADFSSLVTLGHFGLQRRPGEHTLRRFSLVPGSNRLVGLTEDGLLVRW